MLKKYAKLLVNYCLDIKEGDRLFIQTTTLAEPLVREVYREALRAGASLVETDFMFRERSRIFLTEANEAQLRTVSPFYKTAMSEFEAYLHIRAPFNLREDTNVDSAKSKIRGEATKDVSKIYFERTAVRALKRNLCQYPTDASAQEAGMSLEEYQQFVFNACKLFETRSDCCVARSFGVRKQRIVDHLKQLSISFVMSTKKMDINVFNERAYLDEFGWSKPICRVVKFYTSPVEDGVNGVVHFFISVSLQRTRS